MRRHFSNCCFCLPLRSAITTISGISLVVYGGVFIWLLVKRNAISGYFQNEQHVALPFLYLCVTISAIFFICALLGLLSNMQQNRRLLRVFCIFYWIMATAVLCITFAAWIALLVLRDETVASCNQYLNQISSGNTEYDFPGSGPLGTDRRDCDASVRNLIIFGAFVVFVGNALQFYFAVIIAASAFGRTIEHNTPPSIPLQNAGFPQYQQYPQDYYYPQQSNYQPPPPPPPYSTDYSSKPTKY
ncbi:hypothetical protein K492DRAFT_237557 [Lichtheimia hyalospora FSU 10163]|nr:hypothetical protein K492DRAFT_237557 [Lichtheimia hyalospora FSU 10163]